MALKEKLTDLREANLAKFPAEVKTTFQGHLDELMESGLIEAAPKVGEPLPDFNLPNHLGEAVGLAELREKGPVVVTFYRGGWCPYCNLELRAYQDVLSQIKEAGATLVAITPELPDESLTTQERHGLGFEVLTDRESEYAKAIGIAFSVPDSVRTIYENFGIDLDKHNGDGQYVLPLAATFVIKGDGSIVLAAVDADYTIRAEPTDVINVLNSL